MKEIKSVKESDYVLILKKLWKYSKFCETRLVLKSKFQIQNTYVLVKGLQNFWKLKKFIFENKNRCYLFSRMWLILLLFFLMLHLNLFRVPAWPDVKTYSRYVIIPVYPIICAIILDAFLFSL